MASMRSHVYFALAALVLLAGSAQAGPPKPEKVLVAFGSWKGPGASSIKSALRQGLAKDCSFVSAKRARALIEGEIAEQGKGVSVRLTVKATKTGEVVETREFPLPKPSPSHAQAQKMARAVVEMAHRAPGEE